MEVTLYSLAIGQAAKQFDQLRQVHDVDVLPGNVLIDLYLKLAQEGKVGTSKSEELIGELSRVPVFVQLLQVKTKREQLHQIFRMVMAVDVKEKEEALGRETAGDNINHTMHIDCTCTASYKELVDSLLAARLASNFEIKATTEITDKSCRNDILKIGMEIGDFLCEAGWYHEGSKVLKRCMNICLADNDMEGYKRSIQYIEKVLAAEIQYSLHAQARVTFDTATETIKKLKDAEICPNLAAMYSAFSSLSYLECRYNDALEWSVKALDELKGVIHTAQPRMIIDILRQAAKACVVRREFQKAELLIKEAVYLARDIYGSKSVRYALALLDYGYYLLNRDSVHQAVKVYRECLQICQTAYGHYNLVTAIVQEDLAYALYVKEYSSGNFDEARRLSHYAINVMNVLLQCNHLQFASVARVQALILEEIAIDSHGTPMENELLKEAEKLHLHALGLSKRVFGEMNVQIAKHYGNLGRLYQSMRKYSEAETMHLKAISIKETLLGLFDYEVALSMGHLASLYNYDMKQYREAEELHLRSISIWKRLFGDAYSGLEYDYRGLLQIYSIEGNQEKYQQYSRIFRQWKTLRDIKAANLNDLVVSESQFAQPVPKIIDDFFLLEWVNAN